MTVPRPLDLWPRRAAGLPAGQRLLDTFPRFSDVPHRRPPAAGGSITIHVSGAGFEPFALGAAELDGIAAVEAVHDFHCVTTWTYRDARWVGWPMAEVWSALVTPVIGSRQIRYVVAHGGDRFRAVLTVDDLLGPDVLLATELDGSPLDARHGAPLRLVSPAQYGYKSVKHLVGFELHADQPAGAMGAKEHLRARVAHEERHSRLPGRALRLPYRLLIVPTATVAERALS